MQAPVQSPIIPGSIITLPWLNYFNNLSQPTPTPVPYVGAWGDFGGAFETGKYYLDNVASRVYLQGLIVRTGASGVGEIIFTLPVGYRPAGDILLACTATGAFANIKIVAASGSVIFNVGSAITNCSLSGLNFRI